MSEKQITAKHAQELSALCDRAVNSTTSPNDQARLATISLGLAIDNLAMQKELAELRALVEKPTWWQRVWQNLPPRTLRLTKPSRAS